MIADEPVRRYFAHALHGGAERATEGRLFGRRRIFCTEGEDTTRSAADRAALESVFVPMSLLPGCGVTWRVESDDVVLASFDVPPEAEVTELWLVGGGA